LHIRQKEKTETALHNGTMQIKNAMTYKEIALGSFLNIRGSF
jgi:hypothetical protein